ncbi:MAG: hypothetical protein ACK53X_06390, partial [Holosporales bacterium]
ASRGLRPAKGAALAALPHLTQSLSRQYLLYQKTIHYFNLLRSVALRFGNRPMTDSNLNYPPKFGPVNKVQIMVGKTDDDEDPEGVREGI